MKAAIVNINEASAVLKELERELWWREKVYPRLVREGKMAEQEMQERIRLLCVAIVVFQKLTQGLAVVATYAAPEMKEVSKDAAGSD